MQVELPLPDGRRILIDDGALDRYRIAQSPPASPVRRVYAAAHLAFASNYAQVDHSPDHPGLPAEFANAIDWSTTMALRTRLAGLGFGIAEAMDTAQRFEVGWPVASRLIELTGSLKLPHGFVAGAGVDHVDALRSKFDLVTAVSEQITFIRRAGGLPIVLPMLWLARTGATADDYVEVYGDIAMRVGEPLLLHWLGVMFHPELEGYFPAGSFDHILERFSDVYRGAKLSLLDHEHEVRTRAALLPRDQVILTGDDHHFAELIAGTGAAERSGELDGRPLPLGPFSHALLGVFDAIAAPASVALQALARGDRTTFFEIMGPCEELGRHLFAAPTVHYKAGLAFLAWLDGLQPNAMLANHAETRRSREHFVRAVELAAQARVFTNAAVVRARFEHWHHRSGPSAFIA